jgi:hypothetical protein
MDFDRLLASLPERVNGNDMLVWRGRHFSAGVLLQVGSTDFLLSFHQGKLLSVKRGPLVMPSWKFALRADEPSWQQFWQATPAPGYHDIMALAKSRRMRIEGDLHPLMSNLLYFKSVLESIRQSRGDA